MIDLMIHSQEYPQVSVYVCHKLVQSVQIQQPIVPDHTASFRNVAHAIEHRPNTDENPKYMFFIL